MTQEQAIETMKGSRNIKEWNSNRATVIEAIKKREGIVTKTLPDKHWLYELIDGSGLINKVVRRRRRYYAKS